MAKFDVKKLMNSHTKAEAATDETIAFKIEFLDISDIEPSELNKYSVDDVAELKASIELVGLQQNLVVRKRDDMAKYELISGERRYTAISQLVDEGKKDFARVPCKIIKSIDDIQAELQLIFANSTARRLSGHELTWQTGRLTEILRAYRDGGYKMTGKTRDIVAELLKVSPSQVHRLESIDKKLIPELKDEFQKETINTTTAFHLSRLDEAEQRAALADLRSGAELTPENVQARRENAVNSGAGQAAEPETAGKEDGAKMCTEPPPQENGNGAGEGPSGENAEHGAGQELKPCPFCGAGEIELTECGVGLRTFDIEYWHECKGCRASSGICESPEAAVAAWNKRA